MDPDLPLTVLHQLRLVGVAGTPTLAGRCGVTELRLRRELRAVSSESWVRRSSSADGTSRWALTPAGRRHHEQLLAAQLDASGARRRVEAIHARFVPLNDALLAICTDWQVQVLGGTTVPNDHFDDAYDRRIVGRLSTVHRRAAPLLDELAGVLERFRCYRSRLDAARRRVRAGQHDWFTRPGIDSYHTVWFELHEDLLATLGRSRGDVPLAPPVPATGGGPDHLQEQP